MTEPTYRVLMFTPYFPGNESEINGLTLEEAKGYAAQWGEYAKQEDYKPTQHVDESRDIRIYDYYRDTNPTWLRIRIMKERRYGKAQQESAPGAQE